MSIKATVHFYTVDGCNSPSSKCQICCLEMRTSLAPAVNEGGCKSNSQLCQKKYQILQEYKRNKKPCSETDYSWMIGRASLHTKYNCAPVMCFPSRRHGDWGGGSGEQSVDKKQLLLYKKSLILVNLLCNICGGWSWMVINQVLCFAKYTWVFL